MTPRGESTEVDAYIFIKENLRLLGWDTRNPARTPEGQVYTQNECLSHPEIHRMLVDDKPENVIKVTESVFWVVEAKKSHTKLDTALAEAKEYAEKINNSAIIKTKFITGIAGNDVDSYLIRTLYFDGSSYRPISMNSREITGFLSPDEARTILRLNNPNIADMPINEKLFVSKAENINEILHLGAVLPNQRARVMAALLLAMLDDTPPNIDASPSVLISDINSRAKRVLSQQGRPEFIEYIRISLPSTEDNHIKFRNALVSTIQELNILNIRSAMNSGHDVLGHFYEVFLKYANWAKDLGIVLTPRHITQFAAEIMNIGLHDIILDPCCGTGGFLVASLDYVKHNYTAAQVNDFKQNAIFGIEQDPGVASLAIVNMIFRGDGKNNIMEGNCFSQFLAPHISNGNRTAKFSRSQNEHPPITKILMNPPFALKQSAEKEYRFIEHGLNQMEDGGLLFTILPYSVLVKGGEYLTWRKEVLLKNNTLLSVITFPPELFYPIGVHTVGVVIKKGIPHSLEQKVLWVRATRDGFVKSKGKRLPSDDEENDLDRIKSTLKSFLSNPRIAVLTQPRFCKSQPIDFNDRILEMVPEAYLDDVPPKIEDIRSEIDKMIREVIAFQIVQQKKNIEFEKSVFIDRGPKEPLILGNFVLESVLNHLIAGEYHATKELDNGSVPLISCGELANGLVDFFEIPEADQHKNTITVAFNAKPLTTRFHPYVFGAKDDVAVFINKSNLRPTSLTFIGAMLCLQCWRFSYGRKCFIDKLKQQMIQLPKDSSGALDEEFMEQVVKTHPYWRYVEKSMNDSVVNHD